MLPFCIITNSGNNNISGFGTGPNREMFKKLYFNFLNLNSGNIIYQITKTNKFFVILSKEGIYICGINIHVLFDKNILYHKMSSDNIKFILASSHEDTFATLSNSNIFVKHRCNFFRNEFIVEILCEFKIKTGGKIVDAANDGYGILVEESGRYNMYSVLNYNLHMLGTTDYLPKYFKCYCVNYFILDQYNNIVTQNYLIEDVNYIVPSSSYYDEFMYKKNGVSFTHHNNATDKINKNFCKGRVLWYDGSKCFVHIGSNINLGYNDGLMEYFEVGTNKICIDDFYKLWSPMTHRGFKKYIQHNVFIIMMCYYVGGRMFFPKYVLFDIIKMYINGQQN